MKYVLLEETCKSKGECVMPSCEKCWNDSGGNYSVYGQLIENRKNNPCTPEEQAGNDAEKCPKCNRNTMHIYCHICMNCGYKESK